MVDQRLDAVAAGPLLKAALATLPEIDREVLLLVAWEQLTPGEIADALGIPATTARTRLHRARRHMHERLGAGGQVLNEMSRADGDRS
ncbi:sigma-70 family RNA polymerase sigma factor [Kribbella hippodromi]|uniref:RNA polymerase sigma factor n=1 Tax=Kribbella hippodromi TaxID=434347 RepID=UPI0031D7E4D1